MNLVMILEALKFYKLKNARSIQIWFLLLYAVNMLGYLLPVNNDEITQYYDTLTEAIKRTPASLAVLMPPASVWILLGIVLLVGLINLFFTFLYATLYLGEMESLTAGQCVRRCLGALPRLVAFGLFMLIPAAMTFFLAFLPLIFFAVMIYFLPLKLTFERLNLGEAMQQSISATQGRRLYIFAQVLLVGLITVLPQNLILGFIPAGLPAGIVASFFAVARAFIQGRLMGMLYLVIVKKMPLVIPTTRQDGE